MHYIMSLFVENFPIEPVFPPHSSQAMNIQGFNNMSNLII